MGRPAFPRLHSVTSPRAACAPRIALVASAMTVLTLAGHTAGGGRVDLLGLAAVCSLSAGLAATTTRRRLTWSRAWIVLLAGQALLHAILTLTPGHGHGAAAISLPAMALAHVIASMAAAGVVVHADTLIERWSAYLQAAVGALGLPVVAHAAPTGLLTPTDCVGTPALRLMRHRVIRRGPPLWRTERTQ